MFFEKPVRGPVSFARGDAVSFGDVYDIAYDSAIKVDNLNARRVVMDEAYDRRIQTVKDATGIELPSPGRVKYGGRGGARSFTDDDFDARLKALADQFPDKRDLIRPELTPRMEAQQTAGASERRTIDAMSRTPGAGKYVAQFAAGFRASLEDPFQVATLAVGPWRNVGVGAKAVVMSAVKQGVANAGVVGAMQGDVQSWRQEAGLDYGVSQAAANVAMGFAFGAAIDGGGRALYRGLRRGQGLAPKLDERGGVSGWQPPEKPADALDGAISKLPDDSIVKRADAGDVEALRQLADETGVAADPAVQGALRALDLERDLDGRPPGFDEFEADSKLLQALRAAEDADEPAPRAGDLVPPERTPNLADDAPAPLQAFSIEGKPVTFREVSPRNVVTDAETFQFKAGGDVAGATGRLNGVEHWDPIAAGRAVLFERADGQLVIADGHQRMSLAKRLLDQDPMLPSFIFREADGWTPADVRALAAKKNLQEGSGSVIDAAKIMRERPDIIDRSVPLGSEAMRQARALARLSDDAFSDVAAGMAPANYAALVADLVEDKARHGSVLREVLQSDPANAREARFMISDILQAETVHETQLTLLGVNTVSRSLLTERAKVLDGAVKLLRDDARIFGLLTREQDRIERAGNKLSGGNADQALQAAAVQSAIEQLAATRGKVSDWLNDAARGLAAGLPAKQTAEAFAARVRDTLERDGIKGLAAEPETLRAGGFDEPGGEDARLQIEQLERDLGDEITAATKPEVVEQREAQLFKLLDYFEKIDGGGEKGAVRLVHQWQDKGVSTAPLRQRIFGNTNFYTILQKDGASIGHVEITTSPLSRKAFIDMIRIYDDAAALTGRGKIKLIKDLREAYREINPRITEFFGDRISGAREMNDASRRQSVRMAALRSSPYARTPAAERLRPEIQKELLKTVNMLPPDVKMRVMDRVTFPNGREVQGLWDGIDRLVYVSLAHGDPVRTARHEAVHALRQSGLLSDQEFDTLYRFSEELGLREAYGTDASYLDIYTKAYGHRGKDYVEALLREEVIADMFADYSLNGRRFANEVPGGGAIDKIIDTIVQFMERFRNALDGYGFRDVRDVFEAIETGEVARRAMRDNVLPDGSTIWGANLAALKAFHGTPHDVDRFDTGKIGSGEGAQAYGHGLYFAESEAVASNYRRALTYKDAVRKFRSHLPDNAEADELVDMVAEGVFPPKVARIISALQADDWLGFDYPSQAINAAFRGNLDQWDASPELVDAIASYGNVYEVRLNVEPEQLLDWDRPLSEQPATVRKAFEQFGISPDEKGSRAYDLAGAKAVPMPAEDHSWTSVVNVVNDTTTHAGRAAVAAALREAGVPGVRYLDRSSRSKGAGSYNYVIFDDKLIEITAIDGEPVPALRADLSDAERTGDLKELAEVCKL